MLVLRDEQRVARLARMAQILSLTGVGVLVLGLILIFVRRDDPNVFIYQLVALLVGFAISQVGLYYSHRYLRTPRPDEVLDDAVYKFARRHYGRLYHYLMPAPHVLLLDSAVIILVAKYQSGSISVQGDDWKQTGLGLRGWFGQERLGNPTKDAEKELARMQDFVAKHAPDAVGAPMEPIIVFTAGNIDSLDTKNSTIPAMYHSKVAGYLRQRKDLQTPMNSAMFAALRDAFDEEAGDLA